MGFNVALWYEFYQTIQLIIITIIKYKYHTLIFLKLGWT